MTNTLRSMVVEAMLDLALPEGWTWCAADFAGWDFQHDDGTRLEVKQSAARQTWATPARPGAPKFDIRERTGHWIDGSTWVEGVGRNAHIYVLAYHPVVDDSADHRDPVRWVFYVVATNALPAANSISLAGVLRLCDGRSYDQVAHAVEVLRRQLSAPAPPPPLRGPPPP